MPAPQNKPLNTSELYHSNTIAQMSAKSSKVASAHAASISTENITTATNPLVPQLHKSHTSPPNLVAQSSPNNSATHGPSSNVVTNNVPGNTNGIYVNNPNPTAKGESSNASKNGQRESNIYNDPTKNQKWSPPPNAGSTAANTIGNNNKNLNTTNQSANSTSTMTHNIPALPENKINNQNSNLSTTTKTTNVTGGFTAIPQQYKAPSNPSLSVIPTNGNTVTGNQQTRKSNPSVSSNHTSITSVSTSATVTTSASTSMYNSSTNFTATSINTSNNSYSKSAPNITAFNPAGMKPSSVSALGSSGNRQLGVGVGHSGTDESAKGVVGETANDKFSIGVKRKTGENDVHQPPRPNGILEQNQNQTLYSRQAQSIVDSTSSSTSSTNAFLRNSTTHSNYSNHSISKSLVNVNYNQSNNYSFNRHGNSAGSGGMGEHVQIFPVGTVGTNISGHGVGNAANMGENRQYGYGNKRIKGDN
ncbi:hypothetical protein BKA69DRAFT_696118 [Paraphysoderma sedebokerense]|nr:hypothetical protein BKA69DRAFT_696118 [Paraphysoderma sedebokerense]